MITQTQKICKFHIEDLPQVMDLWLSMNIQTHTFIPSQYWLDNFDMVKEMLPQAQVYVYELDAKIVAFTGVITQTIPDMPDIPNRNDTSDILGIPDKSNMQVISATPIISVIPDTQYKGHVAGIFVSTQMQSKGIGKQLLETAKELYSELSLSVYIKNTKAIDFYKREQFIIENKQLDTNTNEIEYHMRWVK